MRKISTLLMLLHALLVPAQAPMDSTVLQYCRERNAQAMTQYGNGEYDLATECFKELAGLGYPPAITNLGIAYMNGTGIWQSSKKALACFSKAAMLDEPTAQMHLGTMYARGIGTEMNDSAAIYWFTKLADQGNTKAMNKIAFIYLNGKPSRQTA